MAITREERLVIEALVKKVTAMSNCITDLENKVTILEELTGTLGDSVFEELTNDEIKDLIKSAVEDIVDNGSTSLRKHDHLSDSAGGDCFAKKGASLID